MNTISLKEFYEKTAQDPELGKKLEALAREYDEKLRAIAAEAGYELDEALPLSDEEAESAAGGYWGGMADWARKSIKDHSRNVGMGEKAK